jgi:hypothetical protein
LPEIADFTPIGQGGVMAKIIPTDKARQGHRGRHLLLILIVALALTAVVWAAVAVYGEMTDRDVPGGAVSAMIVPAGEPAGRGYLVLA